MDSLFGQQGFLSLYLQGRGVSTAPLRGTSGRDRWFSDGIKDLICGHERRERFYRWEGLEVAP